MSRRIRDLLAVVVAAALGSAVMAQALEVLHPLQAAPGTVLAVPVAQNGPGTISATVPAGLTVLGTVQAGVLGSHALITVLVGPNVLAGDYPLVVRLTPEGKGATTRTFTVTVTKHVDARIALAPPDVVQTGTTADVHVNLTNTGNVADTLSVSTYSPDDTSIAPSTVALQPGKSATLLLRVTPRGLGRRYVDLVVGSKVDPAFHTGTEFSYQVYALGTTNPDAPVLAYAIPLRASYGTSSGLKYGASLSLTGDLSSLVGTSSNVLATENARAAYVSLFGKDWGVVYGYGSSSGHNFSVSYRQLTLKGSVGIDNRIQTGVEYTSGSVGFAYSHEWGPLAQDQLYASYSFLVGSNVQITPRVGLQGNVRNDGTYHVSPLVGVDASWTGPVVLLNGDASVAPLTPNPWTLWLSASSRSNTPLSISGYVNVTPPDAQAYVSATETPTDQVLLAQSVAYSNPSDFQAHFGAAISLTNQPISVLAVSDSQWNAGAMSGSAQVTVNRSELPWLASAQVRVDSTTTVSFGETYVANAYSLGGSIALPLRSPFSPTVSTTGAYGNSAFSLGGRVDYLIGADQVGGSLSTSVSLTPSMSLNATAGYAPSSGFVWTIGASASLAGGVAVPMPIVNAFGGLDIGTVTGVLSQVNTDGTTSPIAHTLVELQGSGQSAKTDRGGHYTINAKPGTYTLAFPDLPPTLVPPQHLSVTVRRQSTTRKDLRFTVALGIKGQLYVDTTGVGHPTDKSVGISGVTIVLSGPAGKTVKATTGVAGVFTFRGLEPGRYTVRVDPSTLPSGYEPLSPQETTNVSVATIPFVSIGVRRPKPTVVQTLGGAHLALDATVAPTEAPPGALVTVHAHAPEATAVRASVGSGAPTELTSGGNGSFVGDVSIPKDAGAVALINITASSSAGTGEQQVMVFVAPGPLATVRLDPSYASPNTAVKVTANLLVNAHEVDAVFNSQRTHLAQVGRHDYGGSIVAPSSPGQYTVQLAADGKVLARTTLVVQ